MRTDKRGFDSVLDCGSLRVCAGKVDEVLDSSKGGVAVTEIRSHAGAREGKSSIFQKNKRLVVRTDAENAFVAQIIFS